MNKPKSQGTAFETWTVNWLKNTGQLNPRRLAEGGSNDEGDVRFDTHFEGVWTIECKSAERLNVTRVLSKAREKSPEPRHTVCSGSVSSRVTGSDASQTVSQSSWSWASTRSHSCSDTPTTEPSRRKAMATKQEWATVCAQWPGPGHKSHLTPRTNQAKAKQAVIDNNHHAEMLAAKEGRHSVHRPVTVQADGS